MRLFRFLLLAGLLAMTACSGRDTRQIPPVAQVDVPRFMGDWYVIAQIPTFIEKQAYDSLESYALDADGLIRTTFRYRKGSHDARVRTMHPVGTVREHGNGAVWGMQFVWPIKAEYVIVYLDEDYTQTIVGRSKRDYVWLMARTPTISDADYAERIAFIRTLGYDTDRIRRVPQAAPVR